MVEVPAAVLSQVMELLSPYLASAPPPPSGDHFSFVVAHQVCRLQGEGGFDPESIERLRERTQGNEDLVAHLFDIAYRFESRKGPISNIPAFIFGVQRKKTYDEWQEELSRQSAVSVQSSELDAARKRVEARMREEETFDE